VVTLAVTKAAIQSDVPKMPITTEKFTASEWEKVIQNLQLKPADSNTKPIDQGIILTKFPKVGRIKRDTSASFFVDILNFDEFINCIVGLLIPTMLVVTSSELRK